MSERKIKTSIYPEEIKGMSTDQAEEWFLANGGIPDWWCDPIKQAKATGNNITDVVVDAHLDQFVQGYRNRLGKNARGIGYTRNVEGQGIPGSKRVK